MARIEDYALIGDLADRGARRPRRLDRLAVLARASTRAPASPRCSATPSNGRWRIAPAGDVPTRRAGATATDTLVLETEFETDDGAVRLIDFMPPRETEPGRRPHRRGRRAAGSRCACELVIRFDYGSIVPWVRNARRRASRPSPAPTRSCLRTPVRAATGEDLTHGRRVHGRAQGERVPFVLTWHPSHEPPPERARRRRSARGHGARAGRSGPRAARTRGDGATTVAPLADHAEGAHLRARPAASSPRRRRRCPRGSAACATGTTASAGCATRRSRCYALMLARLRRGGARPGATGCCGRSPASPTDLQIMYGVAGERRLHRVRARLAARLRGLAAGARRQRRRRASSSSTSTARSSTRCYQARRPACAPDGRRGRSSRTLLDVARVAAGASRTRASGRCAARAGTSPTRR